MFIAIAHEIHDPPTFQKCSDEAFPLPDGLHLHQFVPADDLSWAACLYEAPSIERLSSHLEPLLGAAATQRYFPVAEEHAVGLPATQATSPQ